MYAIILQKKAESDIAELKKSGSKSIITKIANLLIELRDHLRSGTGKPELLKHSLPNLWSRRIDAKNRLIYIINDSTVTVIVLSAKGHYTDH